MEYEQIKESYLGTMWSAIASVGWYIVAIVFSLWYVSPYIREKYTNWKTKREEQDYAAKYHKDPDLLQERLAALEASRQKMQREYYQKCMLVQQDKKEREERRKATLKLTGTRLGDNESETDVNDRLPSSTEKKSRSLKGEYNPLMGDNTRKYCPPRRSCCGKGRCG